MALLFILGVRFGSPSFIFVQEVSRWRAAHPRFPSCHMYFYGMFFCNQAPNSLGGHVVVNLVYIFLTRGIEDSV